MPLPSQTLTEIVHNAAGREATAAAELLGVVDSLAHRCDPYDRTWLAVMLVRLAAELDADLLPLTRPN